MYVSVLVFKVVLKHKQPCVLYLYLGWSPSLSSAEAAPNLWPEAAPSATSHFHSSPFSECVGETVVRKKGRKMKGVSAYASTLHTL